MKKKVLLIFLIVFLLSGCSIKQEEKEEKNEFIIQIKEYKDFSNGIYLSKPGRLIGSNEIMVTSQVAGKVSNIYFEDGQKVKKGDKIIYLADTIANYRLKLNQAKSALDTALLNYSQTKVSLEQSVENAKLAKEDAENTFQTTQKQVEQSLRQAKQSLMSSSLKEGTQSRLNLDKSIADLQNQVENIKDQLSSQKTTILVLLEDVLHVVDTYFGVTDFYESKNDDFEKYLGVKNTKNKLILDNLLEKLYKKKEIISDIKISKLTNDDLSENLKLIENTYEEINELLNLANKIFNDSITGPGFSKTTLDSYIAVIDGFQQSQNASKTAFISYKNQVNSTVKGIDGTGYLTDMIEQQYKILLENASLQKESSEIQYEQTLINSDKSLFSAELGLKNAELSYDTAIKNKKTQLEVLENAIDQAQIAYQEALSQYNKLIIRAPIDGIIDVVYVDEGQEISIGTQLFKIVNYDKHLIELFLTSDELKLVDEGVEVLVEYGDEKYIGNVDSINPVANRSILYKIIISLDEKLNLIGDVAEVKIPINLQKDVLPINVVHLLGENSGFVYVYEDEDIKRFEIQLGKVWSDKVEILNKIPKSKKIIINDLSNYDKNEFKLNVKKIE